MQINLIELLEAFSQSNTKDIMSMLSDGDVINAEVVDLSQDNAAVRLPDGRIIKARVSADADVETGDKLEFTVKKNGSKTIFKLNENFENKAFKALKKMGVTPSRQNTDTMKIIIENSLAPDKETINKASFFKAMGLSDSEIVFMIKENLPADKQSIKILRDIKELGITSLIKKFAEAYLKDKISPNLKDIKTKNETNTKDKGKLNLRDFIKKFAFDPKNDSPAEIKKKMQELFKAAEEAAKSENPETAKAAESVKNTLKFMSEINEYKSYFQMPLMNENQPENVEIFAFKNPKKQYDKENLSALICLDFESLGHIDIFIEKIKNNISFQFRLKNDRIISIFKSNMQKLRELLPQYTISAAFKKSDEKFDITYDNSEQTEKIKYSFDMKA